MSSHPHIRSNMQVGSTDYLAHAAKTLISNIVDKYGFNGGICAISNGLSLPVRCIWSSRNISPNLLENNIQLIAQYFSSDAEQQLFLSPNQILLPLFESDNAFGCVVLHGSLNADFRAEFFSDWKSVAAQLADHNFTRRIHVLSALPFAPTIEGEEINEDLFLQHAILTATIGFGANGAVLRVFNKLTSTLMVASSIGDVPSALLADRSSDEILSETIFASARKSSTIINVNSQSHNKQDHHIDPKIISSFEVEGIKAVLCMRLEEPFSRSDSQPIGTLSCYFKRRHVFSNRDIILFEGLVTRIAQGLSLIRESSRLLERTKMLEIQSPVFTQAELAHLLVHDLSHRILAIEAHAEDLVGRYKKENIIREQDNGYSFLMTADSLLQSVNDLKKEIIQLRGVGRMHDVDNVMLANSSFSLHAAVQSVIIMMRNALNRARIDVCIDIPEELNVTGPLKVFEHIILNLVLNTLDAVKAARAIRPVQMHFHGSISSGVLLLRVWDTGPGINRSAFRTPEDVFRIGTTTKATGTGMGLAVVRNLLGRYFGGSLRLQDASKALFEIRLMTRRL